MFQFLDQIPAPLAVFLTAMAPITEVRGAVPLAVSVYHLSWPVALFWSILGNFVGVLIVLFFLDAFYHVFVAHFPFTRPLFDWLFKHTRDKFTVNYQKYGAVTLILFTAMPLPFFGAYTGAVAAFLLGVPMRKSILYLAIGIILAALLVALITYGFVG